MKLILVGIGSFGLSWYEKIKSHPRGFELVVVDSNLQNKSLLHSSTEPFYTSITEAIQKERPDVLINLTPPAVHSSINKIAYKAGLPVLSEKPIAETLEDALGTVQLALEMHIPLMIAENYRRAPIIRKTRQIIETGEIGDLAQVHIQFFKEAFFPKPYLLAMESPTLSDVSVHHFDMIRYLTGCEAGQVFAHNSHPQGSPYPGKASTFALFEMRSGVPVIYDGSLSAKGKETTWNGDWRIEGTHGILTLKDDRLYITKSSRTREIKRLEDAPNANDPLDEFLAALAENREPESSGRDYIKTQAMVQYASLSAKQGHILEIPEYSL